MFTWIDDYSVGIQEIDEQHKKIMQLFNTIIDGLNSIKSPQELIVIIDDAIEYARFHFSTEEKYMEESKYTRLIDHKKEHTDIINSLLQEKDNIGKYFSDNYNSELIVIFKHWFVSHLTFSDKNFYKFLVSCKNTSKVKFK